MNLKRMANAFANASAATLAKRLGVTVTPTWRMLRLPFAMFLQELFANYSIDAVLDVGANLGQYRDFLRDEVGWDGLIISFEPDPGCVRALQKRAENDPNWRIEPFGLGREPGYLQLQLTADSHFNSFLQPRVDGIVADQYRAKSQVSNTLNVEVRTLDDYANLLTDLGIRAPYLKMDTQGFDLEVLRGAAKTLRGVRALQTEASVRQIYDGMPSYLETLQYLTDAGFALSNTFPVSFDKAMRLVEFDCVAVNHFHADAKLKL